MIALTPITLISAHLPFSAFADDPDLKVVHTTRCWDWVDTSNAGCIFVVVATA